MDASDLRASRKDYSDVNIIVKKLYLNIEFN